MWTRNASRYAEFRFFVSYQSERENVNYTDQEEVFYSEAGLIIQKFEGIGWTDILEMTDKERLWFFEKAKEIAENEQEEVKKAKQKSK